MRTPLPKQGDRVTISQLVGYRLVQERPFECRGWALDPRSGRYSGSCKCGECDGHTVTHSGTVEAIIYWADNSIEGTILCDDGVRRIERYAPPSGDVCF